MSSPVSRSVCVSASTIEPRHGCEVLPEKRVHRRVDRVDAGVDGGQDRRRRRCPLVSWVWKWIGRPTSSFSALISIARRGGLQQARHVLEPEHMRAGGLQLLAPCAT